MEKSVSTMSRLRILVADPDPNVEQALAAAFKQGLSECAVFTLQETSSLPRTCSAEELYKHLRHAAMTNKCHVVVIDKALLKDSSAMTWETLYVELQPAHCVVHLGDRVRTLEVVRAWDAGLLVSPIKRQAPSHTPLDSVTNRIVWQRRSRDLTIVPKELLQGIASAISLANEITVEEGEVAELLEYLFFGSRTVVIAGIPNVGLLSSTPRGHSVLLTAIEEDKEGRARLPVVLKIGPRAKVEKEVANYNAHVKGHLKGMRHTYLERSELRWSIGGIVYSLLGSDAGLLKPFADYYSDYVKAQGKVNCEQAELVVRELLTEAFSGVWSKHYAERKRAPQALSLLDRYNGVWGNEWMEGLTALEQQWGSVDLPEEFLKSLPNPAAWIRQNGQRSVIPFSFSAITHGDLHPRNMLVEERKVRDHFANDSVAERRVCYCWLIDFERTAEGPILQDFCELQFNILTRSEFIDPPDNSISILYDLYVALSAPVLLKIQENPVNRMPLPVSFLGVSSDSSVWKAFYTSKFLRELASTVVTNKYEDSREYLWGLLLNAVYRSPQLEYESRRRALLLASVICGRLNKWDNQNSPLADWPPKQWPPVPFVPEGSNIMPQSIESLQSPPSFSRATDENIRLLHLSDIHLGTVEQAEIYYGQLEADLLHGIGCRRLDYLVISGDAADKSTEEEYDAAGLLVENLISRFELNRKNLIVVPGNHDLNFDLSEEAYSTFISERKQASSSAVRFIQQANGRAVCTDEKHYQARFTYFAQFYESVCGQPYPLDSAEQGLLYFFPEHRLLFLALNSAWEIDHHYRNRSSVSMIGLSRALQKLRHEHADWLKIAVWHHPISGPEAMSADFVQQLAVHGFQACMHGHIHEAIEDYHKFDDQRGLRVVGAGTFGAPTRAQTPGIPLQYNLLTIDPVRCEAKVETRKKDKPDGAWTADARWVDKLKSPQPYYTFPIRSWGQCSSRT